MVGVPQDLSPFARLGGEPVLRTIIHEFVEAMCEDAMIGFFFVGVDRARLKTREYEFTAGFLGQPIPYTGRPIPEAHARHRILGGQFDRRSQILRTVLIKYEVPPEVQAIWFAHLETLRAQVVRASC
ncbi:MAG: group 1 truncated hemoglobin [Deltaproteobacteria bacterium]|nr:group 1 truncated hemoglobin [Deltaproteobacteria bacterium]